MIRPDQMLPIHRLNRVASIRSLALLSTCLWTVPAWAQDAATALQPSAPAVRAPASTASDGKDGENTIVVTARRREETLQNVPASVTVLNDKAIETAGIKGVKDLSNSVPSLVINENYRPGVLNISLRGITSVQGAEPAVAVVIDGVQLPGLEFINQSLVDLADIQVLRGPQGALYGRGAIAGAIVIETRKPTNDLDIRGDVSGGNANTYNVSGSISGPIVKDKLFFRAVASYKTSDGLIYNVPTGKPFDFYRTLNLRGQLSWVPDDKTRLDLTANYEHGHDAVSDYILFPGNLPIERFPDFNQQSDPPTIEHRNLEMYSARLSREEDWGTLSAVSSYARSHATFAGDTDFLAAKLFNQYNNILTTSFNQDVRYTSPKDWPVQFFVGGFYQHRVTHNDLFVPGDPSGPFAGVVLADSAQKDVSNAFAGYGQATVPLGANTELGAAIRYDREKASSLDAKVAGSSASAIFSSWQPQVTLRHKLNPNLTVYGTIGKGFSSGGFNAYTDILASPTLPRIFPKETNTNYEAGIKGSISGTGLSFALSGYHTDFRNQVFFFINPGTNSRITLPIARSRINGGEIELTWRATRDLTFNVGGSYNDAKIQDAEVIVNGVSQAYRGNVVPNINKYQIQASVDYTVPVSFGEIYSHAAYSRRGAVRYDLANTYGYRPINFVDLRLGVRWSIFDLSGFANNLTNERYPLYFQNNLIGDGENAVLPNLPRTYGAELRVKF